MKLDLDAIKARCEALDERMGKGPWILEGPSHYGLFSVYDGNGNVISHGVEEKQAFVAHARADVPVLVAEVERLRRWVLIHKARRDQNYESAKKFKKERDEAHAKIDRLGHKLHDEQIQRSEWEKMYNQAIEEAR